MTTTMATVTDATAARNAFRDRLAELQEELAATESELESARTELGEVMAKRGNPEAAKRRVRSLDDHVDGLQRAIGVTERDLAVAEKEVQRATAAEASARARTAVEAGYQALNDLQAEIKGAAERIVATYKRARACRHQARRAENDSHRASGLQSPPIYMVGDAWNRCEGLGPTLQALLAYIGKGKLLQASDGEIAEMLEAERLETEAGV